MAISPPSDLLLDVARAADPSKVREAMARLNRLAADPAAPAAGFGEALAAAGTAATTTAATNSTKPAIVATASGGATLQRAHAAPAGDVYRKFEAVLLQNVVETILPKDDESFGDAASAGIYRSMMAEQLATQIAKAGGIGIATAIAKAHPAASPAGDTA